MTKHQDRMLDLIGEMEKSVSLISSGREQDIVEEMYEVTVQMELDSSVHWIELQNDNSELKESLNKCHAERDSISNKLVEYKANKDKLKKLLGKRVGIIGGHVDEIRRIEAMLEKDLGIKSKTTLGEGSTPPYQTIKEKYRNIDLLIILNGYAGHALTGHAEKLSDEFGIRKIYESANLLNSIKLKVIEVLV